MYYWLTVFSPRAVNFSLGSLSTNWKYPHSQSASWNDFRGPSVLASHAGVFRGARISWREEIRAPLKPPAWEATSVQALPHPSRVSLACVHSLFRPLLPSACYAGYTWTTSEQEDNNLIGVSKCQRNALHRLLVGLAMNTEWRMWSIIELKLLSHAICKNNVLVFLFKTSHWNCFLT